MQRVLPLFIALFSLAVLNAQVGINNPDPEQSLDVNGKVKLSDDATPPTDGTIRYDASSEAFEGYAGGQWQAFNENSIPEDVEEIVVYAFNLPPAAGSDVTANWTADVEVINPETGTFTNVPVPEGKIFVVDHITVTGRDAQPDEFFYVGIAGGNTNGFDVLTIRNPRIYISGNTSTGSQELVAGRAPLLIVRAEDQVVFYNSNNSQTNVRIVLHGFYINQGSLEEFYGY
ncbi:hypothetical protein CEQ90_05780 [Lewinellaceae bacterium SD302]|nr:hypothetical protein CEQ90_05780 [Lewinellaceae bacterium SD302]